MAVLICVIDNSVSPPIEYFLDWCSNISISAPISTGLSEPELRKYIKFRYGKKGLKNLDERIKKCRETGITALEGTVEEIIINNKAGKNECELTLEEIIDLYCRNQCYGKLEIKKIKEKGNSMYFIVTRKFM